MHKHGKEQELRQETDFLRSMAEHKAESDIIFVKNRSRLIRVKTEDLLFVEALKDYVVIHTRTESYTIHSTMKDVETKLGDTDFMRVHRSYIVNIEAIESIKYAIITMDGIDKEIPCGRKLQRSAGPTHQPAIGWRKESRNIEKSADQPALFLFQRKIRSTIE